MLATCAAVAPAAAQDRLFVGTGEIGSAGRFAERLGVAPSAVYGVFVDGGRIVVDGTTAYDTTTGQAAAVQGGEVLAGDPAQPRVFTFDGQTVSAFRFDTRQLTPLVPAQAATFLSVVTARYAPATGLLFVRRPAAGGGGEIVVVDATTATVLRTLPEAWGNTLGWSVSPDGRRLVVNSCSSLPIAVVTAPGPPRQLAATVAGRDLALSWSDGGGITA
ncbi:MAG: hypothetical protein IT181_17295, partial [Acidobacteria bacterium]|nr:hypothetical protein [Acidobacteriota bacterium]